MSGVHSASIIVETTAMMTSEGRSHLAGHRRFSEHFAEVQEGIERLLARC